MPAAFLLSWLLGSGLPWTVLLLAVATLLLFGALLVLHVRGTEQIVPTIKVTVDIDRAWLRQRLGLVAVLLVAVGGLWLLRESQPDQCRTETRTGNRSSLVVTLCATDGGPPPALGPVTFQD